MKLEEKTIFRQLFCLITHLVISSCGACCIRNRGTNYKVLVICKKIFQSSSEVNMRLRQSNQGSIFQIYWLSGSTADGCGLISSSDKLRSAQNEDRMWILFLFANIGARMSDHSRQNLFQCTHGGGLTFV